MVTVRCIAGLTGVVVACGLLPVSSTGVASASPAKSTFSDRSVSRTTDDGWTVTASKARERVRSVPPLNQSPWSREGFLSLKASGRISGTGSSPVSAGTVTGGFQVGCNTDVTSGATVGIAGGPNATLNISYPPALGVGANLQPSISSTLKPGTITDVALGTKRLTAASGSITVDDVHIRVDGCLGPVTLRAYVTVAVSTPLNDDTVNVYGLPHRL